MTSSSLSLVAAYTRLEPALIGLRVIVSEKQKVFSHPLVLPKSEGVLRFCIILTLCLRWLLTQVLSITLGGISRRWVISQVYKQSKTLRVGEGCFDQIMGDEYSHQSQLVKPQTNETHQSSSSKRGSRTYLLQREDWLSRNFWEQTVEMSL